MENVLKTTQKQNNMQKRFFIVIDGPDGAGKEVAARAAAQYFRDLTQPPGIIFDLDAYWQRHHQHPQFDDQHSARGDCCFDYLDPTHFDIVLASEPTHTGIGSAIRNEIVQHKGKYSARFTAEMFAADRQILYKRVLLPALNHSKIWIQQRSFSTSIVYQQAQATDLNEQLSFETILNFEGNQLAQQHPPDLLIIPLIKDIERILNRNKQRTKDDKSFFENISFQKRIADAYAHSTLKDFFERLGTIVEYVDGELPLEAYREAVVSVVKKHYPRHA